MFGPPTPIRRGVAGCRRAEHTTAGIYIMKSSLRVNNDADTGEYRHKSRAIDSFLGLAAAGGGEPTPILQSTTQ